MRKNKSFGLSLPFWSWPSLVVSLGGMGYLPKYEWSHWGALLCSLWPPLLWVVTGQYLLLGNLVGILVGICIMAWIALHAVHMRGVASDHDASAIVIDEVAGSTVAAFAIPVMMGLLGQQDMATGVVCALLVGWIFRWCDLYKPFPALWFDVVWKHPFAVVADDLVAGVYAGGAGIAVAGLVGWLV